jgi:hypothetical protein
MYDVTILNKLYCTKNKRKQDTQRTKWAKFTYIGKETKLITALFKNTNDKITFTTKNTIERLLWTQYSCNQNKYDKCGIYQLTCPACNKRYIRQTSRPFRVRFQEHFRDYKYGNNKYKFAQHLLENGHSVGSMENTMVVTYKTSEGRMMDTLEKFCIYREKKRNNQIN